MMSQFKVLVTRRLPVLAIDVLKERCQIVQWNEDNVVPESFLLEKSKGVHGILCLLTDAINKNVLDTAGDQLQVVSTMSVGVDHLDLEECRKRKISVGYTPDILTSATAELAVGLLLATSRRIVEGTQAVKNGAWGTWKPMWMCGPTLEGSVVGLFGLGRIGLAVLERLKPFGVRKFLYNSQTKKSDSFEREHGVVYASYKELLRESDFLLSCCALTPSTKEIFNEEAFTKMKNSSIFVNIARGGVVQQEHLYRALTEGRIRAAGLDVTTPEPLPPSHPLLQLNNCVVAPHIGSATDETRTAMAVLAANNLMSGLLGEKMPAPYPL